MNYIQRTFTLLIVAMIALGGCVAPQAALPAQPATVQSSAPVKVDATLDTQIYIEATLLTQEDGLLSVIVTGNSPAWRRRQ